ncbi:uncharacterized protein LOC124363410 [Homalodisca vitripennis]|uniref:uncharacterized protein LOC124363410 n=1 Tax=Homalodisca vitripennis TaxID=197043 RepID=UPI001EE9BEA1|nr:uncharacterized protein LOC124363410 [Homalodisca vitripennis]
MTFLRARIKAIKSTYRAEVLKVRESKTSGAGAKDVYKPKLAWFAVADLFMGDVVITRKPKTNLHFKDILSLQSWDRVYQAATADEAYMNFIDTLTIALDITCPCKICIRKKNRGKILALHNPEANSLRKEFILALDKYKKTGNETPQTPVVPVLCTQMTTPSYKKRRLSKLSKVEVAIDKLQKLTENRPSTSRIPIDEVDAFGKYVTAQIRELPLVNRLKLQEKIQRLISGERLKLLEGPRRASPMISGSSSNYGQGSDDESRDNFITENEFIYRNLT